jgi:molybdopterin synthase sulfur carrier subunit
MNIKYFAWIKEITQNDEEDVNSSEIDNLDKLKKYLIIKYPELKKHFNNELIRFAVNQEYVVENITLSPQDEIAVFPPVSGG